MFEGIQVDLQDVTLLEQAGRDNLISFANSGIGQIDYENYLAEVISACELRLCVTLDYAFAQHSLHIHRLHQTELPGLQLLPLSSWLVEPVSFCFGLGEQRSHSRGPPFLLGGPGGPGWPVGESSLTWYGLSWMLPSMLAETRQPKAKLQHIQT